MSDTPIKSRFLTIEQAADELNMKASLTRDLIKVRELGAIQSGARGYRARP